MTAYEIPLTPQPQHFMIALGDVLYTLSLSWCGPAAAWMLDILEADGITAILTGLPLVTGTDLLCQYEYLGFTGQLMVQSDITPSLVPSFDTLGDSGHLYFVVP